MPYKPQRYPFPPWNVTVLVDQDHNLWMAFFQDTPEGAEV